MELSQSLQNRAGAQAAGAAEISRPERNALHAPVDEGPMAAADRPAGVSHLLGAVLQGTESMIRATPGLSIVAAALVALTPVHAFAQGAGDNARVNVRERSRPEYDPLGLRFGGLRLDASLGLSAESTDNLRADSGGPAEPEIDDTVYTVSPAARLSSGWSRHAVSLSAGAASVSHQDTTSEDYDSYYVAGYGRLDIGSRTQLTAEARSAHDVEPYSAPGNNSTAPIEYDEQRYSLGISHTFNRVRLIGRAGGYKQDFDRLVDQDRNLEETSFTGRVEFAVSPRLAIIGQYTEDERDYDNQAQSSDGETYRFGLGVNISNLVRGEITAGQTTRDYNNAADGSQEATSINANFEWYVSGITTLSGFATQDIREEGVGGVGSYNVEHYGVRVDHELLRNLILSAAYSTETRDYRTGVQDDNQDIAAEAEYLLNRRVSLRVRALHEENSSTVDLLEFEETRFLAGLSLRL